MLRRTLVPLLLLLALPARLPAQPDPQAAEQPEVIVVDAIFDQIEKLARRNRKLQRIDTSAIAEFELEYDESVERIETLMNSLPPDKERDCFELERRRMEIDLDAIKRRANEWANGRIDEFRAVHLQTGDMRSRRCFLPAAKVRSSRTSLDNRRRNGCRVPKMG